MCGLWGLLCDVAGCFGSLREGSAQVTRSEALVIRQVWLTGARQMALIASLDWLDWGTRYRAAVVGDECLEIAREADAFIRECAEV